MRHPTLLWLALMVGLGFVFSPHLGFGAGVNLVWKAAGGSLLAFWVLRQGRGRGYAMLAGILGLLAVGDLFLQVQYPVGVAVCMMAHFSLSVLFLSYRGLGRPIIGLAQGQALVVMTMLVAAALVSRPWAPVVAVYTLFLGAMLATALTTPRPLIWVGAWLLWIADLLILARLGVFKEQVWADFGIWLIYFAGQAVMALGMVQAMAWPRRLLSQIPGGYIRFGRGRGPLGVPRVRRRPRMRLPNPQ